MFILSSYYFFSLAKVRNVLREEAKRKNAEKTLKESEEKFRKLFEDHTAVKLLVEPESGVIVDANLAASKFYGWNRNELKCLKIQQIGIINPGELKVNQEKTGYEKRNQVEVSHRLKSGIIRNVEVFSSRITTGERELIHLIIHDITDRKMAEDELIKSKEKAIESDRLKTAFLQNISHEIRTPMNAIMGFSSLLAENFNDKKRIEQFTEIINLRCSDLLEIIDDILDISKIESGQLTVNPDICNLSELFADLSAFFNEHKKRIGKGEVELNLSFLPETIENTIVTDKLKLKQIFMNLLSNAFKFTDNGKIEGGCKYDSKGNLIFFVSDTGIGIPSDKYESIFERFTQLKTVSDRVVSGNGLGLSIVKGLIDLLGGKIWVDSKINYGTTFYFSIPYKISYQHPKADSTTEQFNEVNFRGKTILLVEDDFHITTYIKTILSGTGINIINTEFGSKSVQIALNQKIDLVLMDIRLPDMNGYEAIKQIKKGKPDLPIIAQTAYAATEDKQTAMSCGCIDYISKPIKREHFLFILNKHLSKIK